VVEKGGFEAYIGCYLGRKFDVLLVMVLLTSDATRIPEIAV